LTGHPLSNTVRHELGVRPTCALAVTASEHVASFVAILVGLALAHVAHSLHRLLRARRRVRWNLLAPMAALLVTVSIVNAWWTTNLVFSHALTFAAFLPNLAALVLLFLLASAALPDQVPDHGLDLHVYYMDNRRYFWGLFALWLVALVANEAMISHAGGQSALAILRNTWANLVFAALFAGLMWTSRRWVHGAILIFSLVVLLGSWASRAPGPITAPAPTSVPAA
jgi:hypothetical protein